MEEYITDEEYEQMKEDGKNLILALYEGAPGTMLDAHKVQISNILASLMDTPGSLITYHLPLHAIEYFKEFTLHLTGSIFLLGVENAQFYVQREDDEFYGRWERDGGNKKGYAYRATASHCSTLLQSNHTALFQHSELFIHDAAAPVPSSRCRSKWQIGVPTPDYFNGADFCLG